MKKTSLTAAVVAAFMACQAALADTSSMSTATSGMGVLQNNYVTAGVNGTTGTFGSGGNTSPGLLFDSTGTGTFNTSYDYLTPGSPFDGFSVKIDGTNYTNNNAGGTDITGDGNGLTDGDNTLSWTGGVTGAFDITNTYTLGSTSQYIDITSQITMGTAADDVYFGRFIDPDARAASGDSSSTDNVLGYGVIPDSNVAFSEALSSRYALGLYSTDSNVDAGITRWTTDADSYTENSVDGDGSLTNTGDNTIGLTWHWTGVSATDVLEASYAYIFGPSAFDAADEAVTSGAGGGDTTTTDSWGTLEDVGSATDAAEGTTTVTKTYDYSTATYSDSSYVLVTPWAYHKDSTTGLYDSGSLTLDGSSNTFTLSRTSDVPYTGSDSSTGTDEITESFSRVVTGTGTATMSSYSVGDTTRVSQGFDSSTLQQTYAGSVVEANDQGVITLTYSASAEEVITATTPYTYNYDRTINATNTDDFASDSGYTDGSSSQTITDSTTVTINHVETERETRNAGMSLEMRMDVNQEEVITDINRSINRGTTFGSIGFQRFDSDYGLYDGRTNMFRIGDEKELDNGAVLGFGFHKLKTSVDGETSQTDVDTNQFGVTLSQNVNGWDLQGTLQHSILDIDHSNSVKSTLTVWSDDDYVRHSENIPVGADLSTEGTHTSVSVMAKGPGEIIRPIVGATYGKEKIDGARKTLIEYDGVTYNYELDEINKDYGYGTIGAELNAGPLTVNALHHTDGVNQLVASVDHSPKENVNLNLGLSRTMTDRGDTNSVWAGIVIKF